MADKLQMLEALGWSPSGPTTHTTTTPEDILTALEFAVRNILPGSSDIQSGIDSTEFAGAAEDALRSGDYGTAANEAVWSVLAGLGALPLIPSLGMLRPVKDPGKALDYLQAYSKHRTDGVSQSNAIQELSKRFGETSYLPIRGAGGLTVRPTSRVVEEVEPIRSIDFARLQQLAKEGDTAPLPEYLDWPAAYDEYPGLEKIRPRFYTSEQPEGSYYRSTEVTKDGDSYALVPGEVNVGVVPNDLQNAQVLLHELNHLVSEGARGGLQGTTWSALKDIPSEAFESLDFPRGSNTTDAFHQALQSIQMLDRSIGSERYKQLPEVLRKDIAVAANELGTTFDSAFNENPHMLLDLLKKGQPVAGQESWPMYAASYGENLADALAISDLMKLRSGISNKEFLPPFVRAVEHARFRAPGYKLWE